MFRLWNARKSGRFAAWLSVSHAKQIDQRGKPRRMKHGRGAGWCYRKEKLEDTLPKLAAGASRFKYIIKGVSTEYGSLVRLQNGLGSPARAKP